MEMDRNLESFYNKEIKADGSVKFEELSIEDKVYLSQTRAFAIYKLKLSIFDLKITLKETLKSAFKKK